MLAALVAAAVAHSEAEFGTFMQKHGKVYADEAEYMKRLSIYRENLDRIEYMRMEDPTAEFGVNHLSDMSRDEFSSMKMKPMTSEHLAKSCLSNGAQISEVATAAPASFDWREHSGVVNAVQDQGQCGSCYIFSAVGNIESQMGRQGKLSVLSKQMDIDCLHGSGSIIYNGKNVTVQDNGCDGGFPWIVMNDHRYTHGPVLQSAYGRYQARDGTCKLDKKDIKPVVEVTGYDCITGGEEVMAAYLAENGPLSFAMNADYLQFYTGGVSHPKSCSPLSLDHAMMIVGYGTQKDSSGKDQPVWICRNSWAASWGLKGYFYLYRGDNTCGIAGAVSSAHVKVL